MGLHSCGELWQEGPRYEEADLKALVEPVRAPGPAAPQPTGLGRAGTRTALPGVPPPAPRRPLWVAPRCTPKKKAGHAWERPFIEKAAGKTGITGAPHGHGAPTGPPCPPQRPRERPPQRPGPPSSPQSAAAHPSRRARGPCRQPGAGGWQAPLPRCPARSDPPAPPLPGPPRTHPCSAPRRSGRAWGTSALRGDTRHHPAAPGPAPGAAGRAGRRGGGERARRGSPSPGAMVSTCTPMPVPVPLAPAAPAARRRRGRVCAAAAVTAIEPARHFHRSRPTFHRSRPAVPPWPPPSSAPPPAAISAPRGCRGNAGPAMRDPLGFAPLSPFPARTAAGCVAQHRIN